MILSLVSPFPNSIIFINFFEGDHDAAEVKRLSTAEMLKFCRHFILPSSPTRSKLVVHALAKGLTTDIVQKGVQQTRNLAEKIIITDINEFRSGMALIGRPKQVKDIREYEEQMAGISSSET